MTWSKMTNNEPFDLQPSYFTQIDSDVLTPVTEMELTFRFKNANVGKESGTRVYRSTEPFTEANLPAEPLLTLERGAIGFKDLTADPELTYYYLLETYKGSNKVYSTVAMVDKVGLATGPGSQTLVGGTLENGFFGEVPASELINGVQLASALKLTEGTAQHTNESWLKFALDGKILYVSKKPLRHSISWDALNAVGAVIGADLAVAGFKVKVRLLSGANKNPSTAANGSFDDVGTHGCEWNRLMYHVSAKPFGHASNILASEGIVEGDWASYTEADLLTYYTHGNGSYSWCQETGTTVATRVIRGTLGVSYLTQTASSSSAALYGWRACLELVRD